MKRISVNKDDCSFENKYKFEDLVFRIKSLGGSIIKNGKQTCILGAMIGYILFSTNSFYKLGLNTIETVEFNKKNTQRNKEIISHNDEILNEVNDRIVVANIEASVEQKYHFEENNLCDDEGNIITLNGSTKPIHFICCNINEEILKNIQLSESRTKELFLDGTSVTDNFINYLPKTLESLSLNRCNYITNLNDLPKRCPNITEISINAAASLSDLDFIYHLPNLKEIYISDSVYVTEELLKYLKSKNITTNMEEQDIINSKKIDEIIHDIITPNMNDKEKIQAVCLYILNNVEYDVNKKPESNDSPLNCVLKDGKGVCASYAYFTNILLSKSGINSFEVNNDTHAWNMIELDGKYYYIDTTSMDDCTFYNFLLKILNLANYYMIDTDSTFSTPMSKPSNDKTIIPMSLIKDIQVGRDDKNIFEKYGGQVGNIGVILGAILYGLATGLGPLTLKKVIGNVPSLYHNIRDDYNEIKEDYVGHKSK